MTFHINNFILLYAACLTERNSRDRPDDKYVEKLTSLTMRPALIEGTETVHTHAGFSRPHRVVYLDGWPNEVRNISKDLLDRVISQLKQILPPLRMGNAILFILKRFRGGRRRAIVLPVMPLVLDTVL